VEEPRGSIDAEAHRVAQLYTRLQEEGADIGVRNSDGFGTAAFVRSGVSIPNAIPPSQA
jgi:hypothetical protein